MLVENYLYKHRNRGRTSSGSCSQDCWTLSPLLCPRCLRHYGRGLRCPWLPFSRDHLLQPAPTSCLAPPHLQPKAPVSPAESSVARRKLFPSIIVSHRLPSCQGWLHFEGCVCPQLCQAFPLLGSLFPMMLGWGWRYHAKHFLSGALTWASRFSCLFLTGNIWCWEISPTCWA